MKLEGVVSGQRDEQASREVVGEGITMVVKEEVVVAEGRHGNPHLGQVVQVLQGRHLQHGVHWETGTQRMAESSSHISGTALYVNHSVPAQNKRAKNV